MVETVIETGVRCMFRDESGSNLSTDQMVTGMKVA
jgi:hypothetical protein